MSRISKALRTALEHEETDAIASLANAGENLNAIFDSSLYLTPLAWAAEKGSCALVHSLIENGAEIDTEDLEGNSPLILAAMGGHFEVVEILLSKGANVQHVTRSGWTALDWARNQLHWKIVEQLKKYAG